MILRAHPQEEVKHPWQNSNFVTSEGQRLTRNDRQRRSGGARRSSQISGPARGAATGNPGSGVRGEPWASWEAPSASTDGVGWTQE